MNFHGVTSQFAMGCWYRRAADLQNQEQDRRDRASRRAIPCPHFVVEQRLAKPNFGGNQCAFFVKVYPLPLPMSNTACAKGSALVSIHCLSSKENEDDTEQAMTINGALPPVEAKAAHQWKHR